MAQQVREPLPAPRVLTEDVYSLEELMGLYGVKERRGNVVQQYHLGGRASVPKRGTSTIRYRKEELSPVIEQWEWRRVNQRLHDWWQRFFPAACQTCSSCRRHADHSQTQRFFCKRTASRFQALRCAVAQFLREVMHVGGVTAWWVRQSAERWRGKHATVWGVVCIYLLDRRFVHPSIEELVQLTRVRMLRTEDLTRVWRLRHGQEYQQFCQALQHLMMEAGTYQQALVTVSLFVLLRYGLSGLTELGRALSLEELQQVCDDHGLITTHLGLGIFLPYPLVADVRVGHVVLDELRFFCWSYAAQVMREGGQEGGKGQGNWSQGPHPLEMSVITAVERALAAPLYADSLGIVSHRPV